MSNAKTFNITLEVYTDEDETEFILPDNAEIEEMVRAIDEDDEEAQTMADCPDVEQQTVGRARLAACKRLRKDVEKKRKVREKYLPLCVKRSMTLKLATYRDYLEAEKEAQTINQDGTVTLNESVLMYELLSCSLMNATPEDLSPQVATVIYKKLRRKCWPDPTRLPF